MKRNSSGKNVQRIVALALSVSHLLMVGCASRPTAIPPAFISAEVYGGESCETLRDKQSAVSRELAVLSAKQNSTATLDTTTFWIGMLLLWPATFVPLFTKDNESEIADLKGRQIALDNAISSTCSMKESKEDSGHDGG